MPLVLGLRWWQSVGKMDYPRLETPRLLLREFILSDAPSVQKLAGDPAVAATTANVPHPYLDGMAESWITTHSQLFSERKSLVLALEKKSSHELIGCISIAITGAEAEMGYWVGQDFWNSGYCTEAARALLQFAFETLQLEKVSAHYLARNPGSGRVMEKVGMTEVARFTTDVRGTGNFEEKVGYTILWKDF